MYTLQLLNVVKIAPSDSSRDLLLEKGFILIDSPEDTLTELTEVPEPSEETPAAVEPEVKAKITKKNK